MKRNILLLLFSLFATPYSQALEKLDHNKLATEFVSTLNSRNLKNIEQFVQHHFSPTALARWEGTGKDRYSEYSMNIALFHGRFDSISSELDESNGQIRHINKVYSKNTDMYYNLFINFNTDPSHAITGWYLREAPQKLNKKVITESQLIEEVAQYTEQLSKNGTFSGTVLLAKNDNILFSHAAGLASYRYKVNNNINTKFQIGSMNKMFTSVAVLQLIESGKVSLHDPITKFIDRRIFGSGNFEHIQIRHLLTHTSGIGGMSGFDDIQNEARSLADILPLFKSVDITFEPGTQWQYSNTGMMLLGHLIETVSGENYYDYIDKHIYQKADMTNSGSFDLDVPVENTARNYWFSIKTKQLTENLMLQSVKGLPAGGGYSTVNDLHKFALAMQNGSLVGPQLANRALTAKPELNAESWGYGFSVRKTDAGLVVGHNGAHLGMTARLNVYQDKGYILAVLGNLQTSAWPIVAKVDQLMNHL